MFLNILDSFQMWIKIYGKTLFWHFFSHVINYTQHLHAHEASLISNVANNQHAPKI